MIEPVNYASDPYSAELREMPIPEIGDENVLLKVEAAANCGSDRHQFAGKQSCKVPSLGKKMSLTTPAIEALHPEARGVPKVVLFDFDGTLSLLRAGWAGVMVPMMVAELAAPKSGESEAELHSIVREFVDRLTGKQTIYQMIELAAQVERRGGVPETPLAYKHKYLGLLHKRIAHRLDELRSGRAKPEKYLVPGSIALLQALRKRGMRLYLASGTDEEYMRQEADLLGVTEFFDGGVYGAQDDYKSFSKRILIERILSRSECHGTEILGFGDGFVEIENLKAVGGIAVGVATDEGDCLVVDEWKRNRLAGAGADYIVPNFLNQAELLERIIAS
jgi:phosphoglycolate phosphatase-like HAD superfamily hydrolase